jgi:aminoglycoside 6'-N-acetyltransferase I
MDNPAFLSRHAVLIDLGRSASTMSTTSDIYIRPAHLQDCAPLARMRAALWPDSATKQHAQEVTLILQGNATSTLPVIYLVAETTDQVLVGFLEAGLRSHADGCDPTRAVGFIEGWYVAEGHRQRGVGRKLMAAAEEWARDQGCIEMASDTWIDNNLSQCVHEALGYTVVDRCVHYRKAL